MYIIYRINDGLIAGYSHIRRTEEDTISALTVEIDNNCKSELKGRPSDYGVIEYNDAMPRNLTPKITNGILTWVTPEPTAKELLIESRNKKLQALGLTMDEITA